jgi:hypothetical protein
LLDNIELFGFASLFFCALDRLRAEHSLTVCREDRVGPWGRACEFQSRSGSAIGDRRSAICDQQQAAAFFAALLSETIPGVSHSLPRLAYDSEGGPGRMVTFEQHAILDVRLKSFAIRSRNRDGNLCAHAPDSLAQEARRVLQDSSVIFHPIGPQLRREIAALRC